MALVDNYRYISRLTLGSNTKYKDVEIFLDGLSSEISSEVSRSVSVDTSLDLRLDIVEERDGYLHGSLYNDTAASYADGSPGVEDPSAVTRDGWYFKNTNGPTQKINWYFFDITNPNGASITLADFSAYAIVSFDSLSAGPIMGLYTVPTGSGDVLPGFAHSRIAYSANLTGKVVGKKYLVYFNENPSIHPELERIQLIKSTGSSSGDQLPNELVLTVSYGSDSGAPQNNVQMMVEKLGVYSANYKSLINLKIRHATKASLEIEESRAISVESALSVELSNEIARGLSVEDSIESVLSEYLMDTILIGPSIEVSNNYSDTDYFNILKSRHKIIYVYAKNTSDSNIEITLGGDTINNTPRFFVPNLAEIVATFMRKPGNENELLII